MDERLKLATIERGWRASARAGDKPCVEIISRENVDTVAVFHAPTYEVAVDMAYRFVLASQVPAPQEASQQSSVNTAESGPAPDALPARPPRRAINKTPS